MNQRATVIHVLLVEDSPGDADLTKETLETGKLWLTVDVVTDGEAALDFLYKRGAYPGVATPDLVILDLNLPRLSGGEVLAAMKQEPTLRAIPVVMLTSSDAEKDIAASYSLGVSCYVTKPVGLEAFQAIVRAIEGFWFTVVRLP